MPLKSCSKKKVPRRGAEDAEKTEHSGGRFSLSQRERAGVREKRPIASPPPVHGKPQHPVLDAHQDFEPRTPSSIFSLSSSGGEGRGEEAFEFNLKVHGKKANEEVKPSLRLCVFASLRFRPSRVWKRRNPNDSLSSSVLFMSSLVDLVESRAP
jgi:hypothetical protein